jgi:hypothetical protein
MSTKLLVAVALALLFGLAILFDLPELIPAVAIPCLAWYVWRIYRIGVAGTMLGVISLELVTGIVSVMYRSVGSIFDFMWIQLLIIPAIGFMLASIVTFLVRAWLSHERRRRNLIAAVMACVLPVLWFIFGPRGAAMLSQWELQREIVRVGLPEFVAGVNAVADRLGRAPKDEDELVRLLGKPVPRLSSRGKIFYHARGGKHFRLGFGFDWGEYEFDSETPDRGWHPVY